MCDHRTRALCHFAALLSILVVVEGTAWAGQGVPPPRPGPPDGPRDPSRETRKMIAREAALRSLDKIGTETADPREVQAIIDQIKEDFVRIQVVRNELVRTLKMEQSLDFKTLVNQARELHKRSNRLRHYLIPDSGAKARDGRDHATDLDGEQVRGALVRLCNTIHSFVSNPTLKLDGTVDVDHAIKAARDLQTIVDLSDAVRRSSESLMRSPR